MLKELEEIVRNSNPEAVKNADNISELLNIAPSVDRKLGDSLIESFKTLEKTYLFQKYKIIAGFYLNKIKKIIGKSISYTISFKKDGLKILIGKSDNGHIHSDIIREIMNFTECENYSYNNEWDGPSFLFYYKKDSELELFIQQFLVISPSYFY